jgi:hypothetical protein
MIDKETKYRLGVSIRKLQIDFWHRTMAYKTGRMARQAWGYGPATEKPVGKLPARPEIQLPITLDREASDAAHEQELCIALIPEPYPIPSGYMTWKQWWERKRKREAENDASSASGVPGSLSGRRGT